jgi:chromosome partitioning protein
MLLVVGGIKGGSGKTTIATNLAICRAFNGSNVLLLDADEQQSSYEWDRQRAVHLSSLNVESYTGKDLHKEIEAHDDGHYDDIIIDTGGRDTTSQRAALVMCDAFLAPLRPRSLDIWTVVALRNLNAEILEVNPHFRAMAVLNQCDPRGSDSKTARVIIEETGIECLKTEIGSRKAFPNATSEGKGVIEIDGADRKSIREILSLHDDIYMGDMLHTLNNNENYIWELLGRSRKLLSAAAK